MLNWESGPEILIEKVALNTYLRKWLSMPNRENGVERLTKGVVLNA